MIWDRAEDASDFHIAVCGKSTGHPTWTSALSSIHPHSMSTTSYLKMQTDETEFDDLMKTLTDNFNVLADEVQLLSDRKTILEHKLRFAHEQVRMRRISFFFISASI